MPRPMLMAAVLLLCLSCGNRNQDPVDSSDSATVKTDTSAAAPSPYFPVYDFVRNEIEYVDSLPQAIMKYTTTGKRQDSGYIKLEEFHQLASEFLSPELQEPEFTAKFQESSFADRTTNNSTFFYKSTDTTTAVRRVDVITFKGDVYDQVKSMYIEKQVQSGDSAVTKKLYWIPKRNFQIISVSNSGDAPSNQLIKVVWDNRE